MISFLSHYNNIQIDNFVDNVILNEDYDTIINILNFISEVDNNDSFTEELFEYVDLMGKKLDAGHKRNIAMSQKLSSIDADESAGKIDSLTARKQRNETINNVFARGLKDDEQIRKIPLMHRFANPDDKFDIGSIQKHVLGDSWLASKLKSKLENVAKTKFGKKVLNNVASIIHHAGKNQLKKANAWKNPSPTGGMFDTRINRGVKLINLGRAIRKIPGVK